MQEPKEADTRSEQDGTGAWRPNDVPLPLRIYSLVLALLLLAYGVSGFLNDKLEFATGRGGGGRLLLHGGPAWLLGSAVIVGALLLLSVIVDHYDRRNNEHWYRLVRQSLLYLGFALLAAALTSYFYIGLVR